MIACAGRLMGRRPACSQVIDLLCPLALFFYQILIHAPVGWPEEPEFVAPFPGKPESDERSSVSRRFVEPFLQVLPQLWRGRGVQSQKPGCGGFIDGCGCSCAPVVSH